MKKSLRHAKSCSNPASKHTASRVGLPPRHKKPSLRPRREDSSIGDSKSRKADSQVLSKSKEKGKGIERKKNSRPKFKPLVHLTECSDQFSRDERPSLPLSFPKRAVRPPAKAQKQAMRSSQQQGRKSKQLKRYICKRLKDSIQKESKNTTDLPSTGKQVISPSNSTKKAASWDEEDCPPPPSQPLAPRGLQFSLAQQLHTPSKQSDEGESGVKQHSGNASQDQTSQLLSFQYLGKSPGVGRQSRIVLVDAVLEYASASMLKRETAYLAIEYMDRLAGLEGSLSPWGFRLIAVAGLVVATKREENLASLRRVAAASKIAKEQVASMELLMLKRFRFQLKVRTLHYYTNTFTDKWDHFVKSPRFLTFDAAKKAGEKLLFRERDGKAFLRLNELYQLADCALHLQEVMRLGRRKVAASLLYLLVRHEVEQGGQLAQVKGRFWGGSREVFVDRLGFNQLFSEFLQEYCGLELGDLVPVIRQSSVVFDLPVRIGLPPLGAVTDSYEEFLSFVSHNRRLKAYLLAL